MQINETEHWTKVIGRVYHVFIMWTASLTFTAPRNNVFTFTKFLATCEALGKCPTPSYCLEREDSFNLTSCVALTSCIVKNDLFHINRAYFERYEVQCTFVRFRAYYETSIRLHQARVQIPPWLYTETAAGLQAPGLAEKVYSISTGPELYIEIGVR